MYMCTYVYICVGHAWECQFVMLRNVTVYAQTEKYAPRMRMHQPSPARGKTCACAFLVIQKPNRPPLHRRTGAAAATAPVMVPTISTPLVVGACGQALSRHPDEAFACYLCIGLSSLFCGGPASAVHPGKHGVAPHSHLRYLAKEVLLSCMLGPFFDTTPPLYLSFG